MHEQYDPDAEFIEATVQLVGHDLTYRVRAGKGRAGAVELTVTSPGRAITSDDLRNIPVQRLAAAAREAPLNLGTEKWERPERGKQRLDDDHYRRVAEVARRAFDEGHPRVREAVGQELHASKFTVDKWLRVCRERGYLRPGDLHRYPAK